MLEFAYKLLAYARGYRIQGVFTVSGVLRARKGLLWLWSLEFNQTLHLAFWTLQLSDVRGRIRQFEATKRVLAVWQSF